MSAVASQVGIYDMLRVELAPNGAFNVTEFGTVKDPEQFKALYAIRHTSRCRWNEISFHSDDDRRERRASCAVSFSQNGCTPG